MKHIHVEGNGLDVRRFRTGVSLHSHTLHSREPLSFIYRYARKIAPIRAALVLGERRFAETNGRKLDLSRAYWTPPLAAHDAWRLEASQIQGRFGLNALVSLTDHDNIDAGMTLRVLEEFSDLPVSLEWTVPYRATMFHLGVHNLPGDRARRAMDEFAEFTANPGEDRLRELLEQTASEPATLVVLNHPCWDETEIGHKEHVAFAAEFCGRFGEWIHALELNGLRPMKENRETMQLAEAVGKPLISGGDRHGLEPNATLNLTNAASFDEFVSEIRAGMSEVLFTEHYFEAFPSRILQNVQDVMADHENHGHGWVRWSDRVFYVGDDGEARALRSLWKHTPPAIQIFETGLRALRHPGLKMAFRALVREEAAS
ncbi:MAG: hypothetical protein JSU00_13830 [Acidobacteria bacterium]|nr:hypothetical protein [Acidobacteriota bacterium]